MTFSCAGINNARALFILPLYPLAILIVGWKYNETLTLVSKNSSVLVSLSVKKGGREGGGGERASERASERERERERERENIYINL